jgi:uncharacterized BrkB/YihY/UPF0761 family membrane protein
LFLVRARWRFVVVIATLLGAGVLIATPLAMDVPSAGDVCNANSFEQNDALEAEKTRAARFPLVGALLSLIAAVVAIISVVQRRPPGSREAMLWLALLGVVGVVVGLSAALLTYAVIC